MSKGESGYPDPDVFDEDLYSNLLTLPDGTRIDLKWIQENIAQDAKGKKKDLLDHAENV